VIRVAQIDKKSELMLMRRATASIEIAATSGISVQRVILSVFCRGYPHFTPPNGGLLEPRGSKRRVLKSTFVAEMFVRRLSWSVSSDFGAVHS